MRWHAKPRERPSARETPRLVAAALRLAWKASPRALLAAGAFQLASALGAAASVLVAEAAFGSVLTGRAEGHLAPALLPIVGLACLALVLELVQVAEAELNRILAELVSRAALDKVLEVATGVDLIQYDDPGFHDRLRRAQMQGQYRGLQTVQAVLGLIGALAAIIGLITVLATLQPLVVPPLVLGYLPLWLLASRNTLDLYDATFDLTPNDRERTYLLQLMTSRDAAKEIRAFNLGSFLRSRYDRLYDLRVESLKAVARRRAIRGSLGSLGSASSLLFAIGLLAWLHSSGSLSLAATGAAAYGLYMLSGSLRSAHVSGAGLYDATVFLRDYEDFNHAGATSQPYRPKAPRAFRDLVVEHVSFTYPGSLRAALEDVSLEIHAGQLVALVGENGSGKTTLAKLLAGLYVPERGRICWDSIDIRDFDPIELREAIALVFQDFERYRLPAHDNIALGRYQRADDREAVRDAARLAGADEFLSNLPTGYETILGSEFLSGLDLSIGEWQRVALARSMFRNAGFVILDEPTASLDAFAERRLADRVRVLLENRSVLLISHRLAAARTADHIYVLQAGRIAEQGSHDELLHAEGIYAHLFTLQASSYGQTAAFA
jgi:ATP-binding cassette, subfamily B, bacterial